MKCIIYKARVHSMLLILLPCSTKEKIWKKISISWLVEYLDLQQVKCGNVKQYIHICVCVCFHGVEDYIVIFLLPWYKHFRRKYYSTFTVKWWSYILVGVPTTAIQPSFPGTSIAELRNIGKCVRGQHEIMYLRLPHAWLLVCSS